MLKTIRLALLSLLAITLSPLAQADQALANAKGCMACHDLKIKKVGPAYQEVAKKYVGEADAQKLVAWILALK